VDQIEALPVEALSGYAAALGVLELAPHNGRPNKPGQTGGTDA
jgi:hypothetical protein